MAIALYWNGTELEILRQIVQAASTDSTISQQQRNFAKNLLNAGLSTWQTAPIESGPRAAGDVDCRRLLLNVSVTLVQVRDYLATRRFTEPGGLGDRYPGCIVKELLRAGGEQL